MRGGQIATYKSKDVQHLRGVEHLSCNKQNSILFYNKRPNTRKTIARHSIKIYTCR